MAKLVHSYAFKGQFDLDDMTISEYDKKTEETTVYSLLEALKGFDGLEISISFKEEQAPTPVRDDEDDEDEDFE